MTMNKYVANAPKKLQKVAEWAEANGIQYGFHAAVEKDPIEYVLIFLKMHKHNITVRESQQDKTLEYFDIHTGICIWGEPEEIIEKLKEVCCAENVTEK